MPSIDHSHGRTSFGADPDAYDAARPPYPPDLFDWLRATCGLDPTSSAFEIGAGTGLATWPVMALPVRGLLAIEPDHRFVARLVSAGATPIEDVRQASALGPPSADVEVVAAPFEDVHLLPEMFDFGFAATSLHWLARGKALAKAFEALRPGGWFSAFWHVFHNPQTPDAFDLATEHLFSGLEQQGRAGQPATAFALDRAARLGDLSRAGFVDLQSRVFHDRRTFTGEAIARLYSTLSRVSGAPDAVRQTLLADMQRIARDHFQDRVEREILTSAYLGRRPASGNRPAAPMSR